MRLKEGVKEEKRRKSGSTVEVDRGWEEKGVDLSGGYF